MPGNKNPSRKADNEQLQLCKTSRHAIPELMLFYTYYNSIFPSQANGDFTSWLCIVIAYEVF